MHPDDARRIVSGFATVAPSSPDLIGFEPRTQPLDIHSEDGARQLASFWNDAVAAGRCVLAVREPNGRLTIWQQEHAFWTVPDPIESRP